LLDAINNGKNYFDYRLDRQHAFLDKNEFVKDLSKLGRDIKKIIIIIDNMHRISHYKKRMESILRPNGVMIIMIRHYWI
jgi:TFIIF-interacting CTD phosphatase-like protein